MRSIFAVILLLFCGCAKSQSLVSPDESGLRAGDLLFLDLDCGKLCDGIETVTKVQFDSAGPSLSHVGMLWQERGEWFVYEAWEKVKKTPLAEFIERGPSYRARVVEPYRSLLPKVAKTIESKLGLPYDSDFVAGDQKYYCSELIAEAFMEAHPQYWIFPYMPMYFGDSKNPKDSSWVIWQEYFAQRSQQVPQGERGVSPLGIYLSKHVQHMDLEF